NIIHILSTPRSSSTALERSLFNSSAIDIQINDVWANYRDKDRISKVYQQILNEVKNALKKKNKITVLIKSIADYIPPGDEYGKMCRLVSNTIVLIRNPILQMESLLRVMAESLSGNRSIIHGLTMDDYAKNSGYPNWKEMQLSVVQEKSYYKYEKILKIYFPIEQEAHGMDYMRVPIIENLREETVQGMGFQSLDSYAKQNNYPGWSNLVSSIKLNSKIVNNLGPLLEYIFQCRITGWEALIQHIQTMDKLYYPYIVIDSTMFRLLPSEFLKEISRKIGIEFSNSLVNWKGVNKNFNPGDDEGISYYQKVIDSVKIEPPSELPCELRCFPEFVIQHILSSGGALEVYLSLFSKIRNQFGNEIMLKMLDCNCNGATFKDIDPVFTYSIYKFLNDEKKAYDMKNRHTEFSTIFTVVDEYFKNHQK
ncbi:MAG: hypothetical protein NTV98_02215, partial [Candidatus Roizmanbacteria bacterium]|nr:hypothetical protein [Candidatus Roizmanbacteria bacterium]